jgi:hypothetical protein
MERYVIGCGTEYNLRAIAEKHIGANVVESMENFALLPLSSPDPFIARFRGLEFNCLPFARFQKKPAFKSTLLFNLSRIRFNVVIPGKEPIPLIQPASYAFFPDATVVDLIGMDARFEVLEEDEYAYESLIIAVLF